jgi:hypothetical protein
LCETGLNGAVYFARVEAAAKDSLDIHLTNGNIILLETKYILELPGFAQLAEDGRILYPKTDGKTIYWRDGPRPIGLDEILSLVSKK